MSLVLHVSLRFSFPFLFSSRHPSHPPPCPGVLSLRRPIHDTPHPRPRPHPLSPRTQSARLRTCLQPLHPLPQGSAASHTRSFFQTTRSLSSCPQKSQDLGKTPGISTRTDAKTGPTYRRLTPFCASRRITKPLLTCPTTSCLAFHG